LRGFGFCVEMRGDGFGIRGREAGGFVGVARWGWWRGGFAVSAKIEKSGVWLTGGVVGWGFSAVGEQRSACLACVGEGL